MSSTKVLGGWLNAKLLSAMAGTSPLAVVLTGGRLAELERSEVQTRQAPVPSGPLGGKCTSMVQDRPRAGFKDVSGPVLHRERARRPPGDPLGVNLFMNRTTGRTDTWFQKVPFSGTKRDQVGHDTMAGELPRRAVRIVADWAPATSSGATRELGSHATPPASPADRAAFSMRSRSRSTPPRSSAARYLSKTIRSPRGDRTAGQRRSG